MDTKDDFMAAVEIDCNSGCWVWIGGIHKSTGYARLRWRGKDAHGHRISFELFKGPIPSGLQIDHLCRNRKCVNPDHLEAVTRYENIIRGEWGAGKNKRRTHCVNGHEFTDENTRWHGDGRYRGCRTCAAIRSRHYWRIKHGQHPAWSSTTPVDWTLPKLRGPRGSG